MKHKPSEADSSCEDCGESKGQCKCDALAVFYDEVADVLAKLDELAEVWGDEGVFRRCRDGLRKSLAKVQFERDSPAEEPAHAPLVWSSERPTAAGKWWFRAFEGASAYVVNLNEREIAKRWDWDEHCRFAGPILEPVEPT